jgi:hypothetical protein
MFLHPDGKFIRLQVDCATSFLEHNRPNRIGIVLLDGKRCLRLHDYSLFSDTGTVCCFSGTCFLSFFPKIRS